MWVEPAKVSPALVGKHETAAQGLSGRLGMELAHQTGDEAAGLSEQVGMKAEGGSQDLRHGEGEHAVRQPQEEPSLRNSANSRVLFCEQEGHR
jgi:hypothetical protein